MVMPGRKKAIDICGDRGYLYNCASSKIYFSAKSFSAFTRLITWRRDHEDEQGPADVDDDEAKTGDGEMRNAMRN